MGMHEKIATKRNIFGIWGHPLGATAPCHIHKKFFGKHFSGTTFLSQIVCLDVEPTVYRPFKKSNRTSNLTILKKSPTKFNLFEIIADARGSYRQVL